MILKMLQTLVPEFPKLEPGDPASRARRLQQWLLQVSQSLEPAGYHVTAWWSWARTTAEEAHRVFLTKSVEERESVQPQSEVPPRHAVVESWMRPRILACLLKNQREWVDLRAQAGVVDSSSCLVFYLFKFFAPGSPNDKDALLKRVLNPNVCTNPQAAQIELMRWRTDVQRLRRLGCMPPDLTVSYRALESIFGNVFDKAEQQLNLRWVMLKNRLGLPHVITPEAFKEVSQFADMELGALILLGGTSLNPGLPLTDNQRARQQQLRDNDKKAAAARAAAASSRVGQPSDGTAAAADPWSRYAPPPPMPVAARLSSSTGMWASPCKFWKAGECTRGISCTFAHEGVPLEDKRCFICKSKDHTSPECTCPGGGKDPEKDKHWNEYRARREQAGESGKAGKGKGKGKKGDAQRHEKGGGKGKGKKGDAQKGDPWRAWTGTRACLDLARAAAASDESSSLPRNCVALDSWANVWLKHRRNMPEAWFQDTLQLDHGECHCHRDVSDKGVPIVWVPFDPSKQNIDLFPEGFLWERGCSIMRDDNLLVRNPQGREFQVKMWHEMPYVSKDDLHQILSDLPAAHVKGRSGKTVLTPTAARVAHVRVDLEHLKDYMDKSDIIKIRGKYRPLPDLYWQDQAEKVVTPGRFAELGSKAVQQPKQSQLAKMWEACSGPGALSARARERRVPHLSPIDLRYGWYTHRRKDQELIMYGVMIIGVLCYFAAPNCALWGNMTANMPRELLQLRRNKETPG